MPMEWTLWQNILFFGSAFLTALFIVRVHEYRLHKKITKTKTKTKTKFEKIR